MAWFILLTSSRASFDWLPTPPLALVWSGWADDFTGDGTLTSGVDGALLTGP